MNSLVHLITTISDPFIEQLNVSMFWFWCGYTERQDILDSSVQHISVYGSYTASHISD